MSNGGDTETVGHFDPGDSLFDRALRPVVDRAMHRGFRSSLKTMKALIEAEYAAQERDPVEA